MLNFSRNVFTYLASIIVLASFWALLEHVNQGGDISSIGPADKKIFWVRADFLVITLGIHGSC